MFSGLFKGINRQKKNFMSRLENELESIYTNSLKRNQTGVTKLPIIDKKDFIVDNCKCNNIYNLPEWRDASNFSVLYKSGAPLCRTSFNRKF
jgi:hypothetical protein